VHLDDVGVLPVTARIVIGRRHQMLAERDAEAVQHAGQGRRAAAMHPEHDQCGRTGQRAAPGLQAHSARRLIGERDIVHPKLSPSRREIYHEFP
jgi:hypothetical protein